MLKGAKFFRLQLQRHLNLFQHMSSNIFQHHIFVYLAVLKYIVWKQLLLRNMLQDHITTLVYTLLCKLLM